MSAPREEYDGGHIENAVLVPNESIGSEMPEALPDKEATLLIYCRSWPPQQGCRTKAAGAGVSERLRLRHDPDCPNSIQGHGR